MVFIVLPAELNYFLLIKLKYKNIKTMTIRHLFLAFALLFVAFSFAFSQEGEKEKKFGITFGGFVKNDVFYETRQTVNAREGHFSLYPLNVKNDVVGNDINATPTFNMLAIQTRLTGKITGPDAFGAKTSGTIEGEFFGTGNDNVSGFRIRHAFVKLTWDKAELLSGQFWHPMFVAQSFPEVLNFNTGVPFTPFSRNPQMRFTYKIGSLNLIATAYTLRDFPTTGPSNPATIQRNPGMPNANFTFTITPPDSKNIFGVGIDYKTVRPEIETALGYKTNTTISGISATAFAKGVFGDLTCKLQGYYAQNAFDIMGIGGYAVLLNSVDATTGRREYTNLNTGSAWLEVYYTKGSFVGGVFNGYTMNLGSNDRMDLDAMFARGGNIEYIYRVAPRVAFTQGKTTIGFELEYTTVAYGTSDNMCKFTNSKEVSNIRGMMSFIYKF